MKVRKLSAAVLALALSACAQTAKTVAPPSAPPVVAEAPSPPPVQAAPAVDAAAVALAGRDLRALGYPVGKSDDINDATLRHAILAFEQDQGLAEDGQLSPALEERLKQLRAGLLRKTAAQNNRSALFVYSDDTIRSGGLSLLPPVPAGLASDAPADLLRPMRPGSQASYHLGHRTQDGGFVATRSISCQVGHITQANTVFGPADVLPVDCHMEGDATHSWHSLYSPMLDTAVQQDSAGKIRTLVAIRPSTTNWPSAARTGLDWAITHALETPASDIPVEWSSTGVTQHFEVRAFGKVSGPELGLAAKYADISCRRFELFENGRPPARYPGVACENGTGVWTLAGTGIVLSSPAKAMSMHASPNLKSAQNP
jgi:peptidoglycan hydrolase-like protein with peptidoglycan-binding domain